MFSIELLLILIACLSAFFFFAHQRSKNSKILCESVNYHLTRVCNFKCKFCFHTAKSSYKEVLPLQKAQEGLSLLKAKGMKKINFSGGEPFTVDHLGELVRYCKKDLRLESVSIVSNGSYIKEEWFRKYSEYLDILAISCDSFVPETLNEIGRGINEGNGQQVLLHLKHIADLCKKYKVLFKLNTVVNSKNYKENMNSNIKELNPYRWKVFQCLLVEGENFGEDALRNAKEMVVSTEQFEEFIKNHQENHPVPEDNTNMRKQLFDS